MAKAAKIQDTVHLLCKMFSDCGIPKISPETFRQAKFNKPEACECLWQFLYHVITFLEHVKQDKAELYQPDKNNTNPTLCVAKVKIFFYNLGYTRNEFYAGTYLSGSRELLLAFGWLLNEVQLLNIMRTYHLKQARMDGIEGNSGYHLVVSSLLDEVLYMEEECAGIIAKLKSRDQLCSCIQRLTWLNGRICMAYRQFAETYTSLLKLIHRLDMYSHNDSRQSHISLYGWYLLMHPRELSRQMKKLERHILALQSIMEWQKHDTIFWKWMESVIDAYKKAEIKCTSEEDEMESKPLKKLSSTDTLCTEFGDLYKRLSEMLREKESQITSINQIWQTKLSQIDSVELKKEMHRIDNEFRSSTIYYQILEQQTTEFYNKCPININKLLPEFIYVSTSAKLHKSSNVEHVSELNTVAGETCRLKQSITEVDEKVSLLRTELQAEFDKLISSRKLTTFYM